MKILRHKTPSHGTVAHRTTTNTASNVIIAAFTGQDNLGGTIAIDGDTTITLVIGTEGIAKGRCALGPQLVVVVIVVVHPTAAFQQHHAQTRLRQFLGDNSATGSGPNNDDIHFG